MKNNFYSKEIYTSLYGSPSSQSKICTEIIYGEKFKILSKTKGWLKIKTSFDSYIGYIKNINYSQKFNFTHKVNVLKAKITKSPNNFSNDKSKKFLPFASRIEILKLDGNSKGEAISLIKSIYKMFVSTDANMVEINPLILTKEKKVVCLDAKVNFDDNALFRHREIVDLRDLNEEDPAEIEASKHDLAYIKLEGSIGCMVNGAGLAMATMDIIKLYGSEPANFLDVGGGASKEKVSAAFKIILSDKNVKGILINIFGGIMRCDVLAQGVVDAAKEININVPLVVRLAGTNFKEGKKILDNSGLKLISAENLDDAAKKIVEAIK